MVTCSDTRIFLSVTTSCEIRRLVSSSPPAPPNRRHWISPPPSPQLRLLARYADSYLSVRRRLRIDVTGYLRPSSPQLRLLARYADSYLSVRRRLRIDVTGYLRPSSPQLRLLARYADSYLSVRRRLRIDVTGYLRPSSPQLRLLARYADLYLRLRRRLRIDVTGYLRRHPLSCDFLRDTPTRILVSVGASESTSLDISARRFKSHLKCTFLTFSTQSTNDRSSAEPQKCRSCLSR